MLNFYLHGLSFHIYFLLFKIVGLFLLPSCLPKSERRHFCQLFIIYGALRCVFSLKDGETFKLPTEREDDGGFIKSW